MNYQKLKRVMAQNGISQRKLADRIGMSRTAFANRMNGRTEFRVDEVNAICDVLNISDPAEKSNIFFVPMKDRTSCS